MFSSRTILSVRSPLGVILIGDGQVSQGSTVVKPNARKIRVIGSGSSAVICGFAGATADCLTLMDLLEKKLDEHPGQLMRASVELAKMWRTDKILRHLESSLIAADRNLTLTISGDGDVIGDPVDGIAAIGSGGLYALSAARALRGLADQTELSNREIAIRSMFLASDLCVYTNGNFVVEEIAGGELILGEEKSAAELRDRKLLGKLGGKIDINSSEIHQMANSNVQKK